MADVSASSASQTSTKEAVVSKIVSLVGERTLRTVPPTLTPNIQPTIPLNPFTPADDDFIPSCVTQAPIPKALSNTKDKNLGAIMLGMAHECPRWAPGSVIKWIVLKEGFKTPADAEYAARHLSMACQKWNEFNVGVTFEWVSSMEDTTFALFHAPSYGNALASAFFPNPNHMSMMGVYNPAFSLPKWKENMWKMFMHELGHVLGLRHEFAMDTVTGDKTEMFGAVQLGPRNEQSVMTYGREPPEIQESDIESTRSFYKLKDGDMMGLTPVQDYIPM
ncbi:hypothetical protein K4K61_003323 [Colletotrichum sp. SAR11_59]|nr:hypothetical protein K4K61_003323 [Colletotrichum sp. SAR11_59]